MSSKPICAALHMSLAGQACHQVAHAFLSARNWSRLNESESEYGNWKTVAPCQKNEQ
jgi:hypothetical protein